MLLILSVHSFNETFWSNNKINDEGIVITVVLPEVEAQNFVILTNKKDIR